MKVKIKLIYFILYSGTNNNDIVFLKNNIINKEISKDNIRNKKDINFNQIYNDNIECKKEEKGIKIKYKEHVLYFSYDKFPNDFFDILTSKLEGMSYTDLKMESYKKCYFNIFNYENYFSQNNPFFNNLLKAIKTSNLIKNSTHKFSKIKSIDENFLNDEELSNFIISRIIYFPVDKACLECNQALTTSYDLYIEFSEFPKTIEGKIIPEF